MRLMPSVAALVAAFAAWTQLRLYPHTERSCPCLEPQYLWGYQTHEMPSLEGQVAIVTGANVGLGLSTAKLLLQKGATVVMGCRRMGSCNDAKESLRNKIPNLDQAVPMHIDLSSLKSVSSFVENFERQFDRLDVIVLNAAVFPVDYAVATETQLELAFSVNHVGHFLLTTQLLQRYAEPMVSLGGIKVSVVSSNHHFFSYDPPLWISPPEQGLANASLFDSNAAYGHSKLANIYFAQELTRRLDRQGLDHIFVNSAHPGKWPSVWLGFALLAIVNHCLCVDPLLTRSSACVSGKELTHSPCANACCSTYVSRSI